MLSAFHADSEYSCFLRTVVRGFSVVGRRRNERKEEGENEKELENRPTSRFFIQDRLITQNCRLNIFQLTQLSFNN